MALMTEKELQDELIKKEAKKILIKKIKEKLMPVVFWVGLSLIAGLLTCIFLG